MKLSIQLALFLILESCLVRSLADSEEGPEVNLFVNSEKYDVETTVMLNEVARRDKEVAYKVKSTLEVVPVWKRSDSEFLLKFELVSPKLLSRGKHVNADFLPHNSIWDSYPQSVFYAHWKKGQIVNAYLDLNELPDIVNYKRSLISLFQLQMLDGEGTEIDVSGNCSVAYETLSENVIRKIKSRCEGEGEWGETRRVTRYTLGAGLRHVHEVHAEEVHELRLAGGGLKTRAWHRLANAASAPATPAALPELPALLDDLPAWLAPAALYEPPEFPQHWPTDQILDEEKALAAGEELWAAREPGAGGIAAAQAALRVLPALCATSAARLAALLHRMPDTARLGSLVTALGACGAAHTHAAVTALLQLHVTAAAEPVAAPLTALAADYLAALALAPRPEEGVVEEVLRLGVWPEREDRESLAESALACAAACARRLPAPAAAAVRDRLLAALVACQGERCRVAHLRAFGSLGCAGAADALLRWAEAGAAGEALAALDALAALPPRALRPRLRRLHALVASGRPLPVRAAALDLLLRRSADAPFGLPPLVHALLDQDDNELVRVLWQRLQVLADSYADVARLLNSLPAALRARALLAPGTSSVLARGVGSVGGANGAWHAELDSVQVARGGALRRGVVRLVTHGPHIADDTLTVEVQTSGLESFVGASADAVEGGDQEPLSAALVLSVGGVRLPPVPLFNGQAELLAHVWAGTGSAPTAVLRALRPLPAAGGALRLLDGAVLLLRREAVAYVALDAHAQVSLWSRSARAALEARGGVAVRGALAVGSAWGELAATAELQLEPRLRIAADLDFYDAVALCVRVRAPAHEPAWRLALNSTLGSDARGVRRERRLAWHAPGRTLALGAQNDAACRTLASAED